MLIGITTILEYWENWKFPFSQKDKKQDLLFEEWIKMCFQLRRETDLDWDGRNATDCF